MVDKYFWGFIRQLFQVHICSMHCSFYVPFFSLLHEHYQQWQYNDVKTLLLYLISISRDNTAFLTRIILCVVKENG